MKVILKLNYNRKNNKKIFYLNINNLKENI